MRISPEKIKAIAYTTTIKMYIDIALSWLFPLQCVVVLVDCIISMCCKPHPRTVTLRVKTENGRILCKVDPEGL